MTGELILPDSRLRDRNKGVVRGTVEGFGCINWTPIYCADCGKFYGWVPTDNCDFVCWLCDTPNGGCSAKHGAEYGLAFMPNEVFWEKVKWEQLEKHGRLLSPVEVQAIADSGCSPLATLIREGK